MSWVMLLGAAAWASNGIILLTTRSDGLAQGVLNLMDSRVFVILAIAAWGAARQVRRNLTKALRVNQDDAVLDG